MLKKIIYLAIFILSFSACDGTYVYSVYVTNKTDETLQINYKTPHPNNGEKEGIAHVEAGKGKVIFTTSNLDISNTKLDRCHVVADYVTAYIRKDKPSTIEWCGDQVRYQTVDIGEGEFLIEYTLEDFKLN